LGFAKDLFPGFDSKGLNNNEVLNKAVTRTAWAVFKYCGTKTALLRRKI
jgi:hypothetical protein